jgi:hypothetical protein
VEDWPEENRPEKTKTNFTEKQKQFLLFIFYKKISFVIKH